ncbi:MAG: hypothetical protein GY861_22265 [bacterium]|nr:hypothetical protein [bacterium]
MKKLFELEVISDPEDGMVEVYTGRTTGNGRKDIAVINTNRKVRLDKVDLGYRSNETPYIALMKLVSSIIYNKDLLQSIEIALSTLREYAHSENTRSALHMHAGWILSTLDYLGQGSINSSSADSQSDPTKSFQKHDYKAERAKLLLDSINNELNITNKRGETYEKCVAILSKKWLSFKR